jgi:hypothetical protein
LYSALPQEQEQKELHMKVQEVFDGLWKFGRQAAEQNIHPQLIQELNLQKFLKLGWKDKISLIWKNVSPLSRSIS